jgi:hypothetical protein
MRKRTEKFIAVKINSAHTKLQERVSYIRVFRRNHEQLRAMTGPGGGLKALGFDAFSDVDMDGEVGQAYEGLRNVPVLDVTTGETLHPRKSFFRSSSVFFSFCRRDRDLGHRRELVQRKDLSSRESDHSQASRQVVGRP